MSDQPKYLTVAEAAAEMRMSTRYVLDALRRKDLRGTQLGGYWRIKPTDLETYMDAKANVSKVRAS